LFFGRLGQQAEDRQAHQKPARNRASAEPERYVEGLTLRLGQALRQLEERGSELLERCERKLHLTLDPGYAGDPKVPGGLDRTLEQGRLPDACFAVENQDAASSFAGAAQQPVEHLSLASSAEQPTCRSENRR
jgi:hypothetical protein